MSTPDVFRQLLCKFLKLPETASRPEIDAAVEKLAHRTALQIQLAALTTEADELERAAKVAASAGMFESGATLRNRAAGIRRALEVLQPITTADES